MDWRAAVEVMACGVWDGKIDEEDEAVWLLSQVFDVSEAALWEEFNRLWDARMEAGDVPAAEVSVTDWLATSEGRTWLKTQILASSENPWDVIGPNSL